MKSKYLEAQRRIRNMAEGGNVEPTPEDMRLRKFMQSHKYPDVSSGGGGGDTGSGIGEGIYQILKVIKPGMGKEKGPEDLEVKQDVDTSYADGGLIGSLASMDPNLKEQYNVFPTAMLYNEPNKPQVPTARPTPFAEGGEGLAELERQYKAALANSEATYLSPDQRAKFKTDADELSKKIEEAKAAVSSEPAPEPTATPTPEPAPETPKAALDEAAPAPSGRKPLGDDPDAPTRAETTLRLREAINNDAELSDGDKTILRDKIVSLGATKGVKGDAVTAAYQSEIAKMKAAAKAPAKEEGPSVKKKAAEPAAPQKVVIPMTLEGGTGDLATVSYSPINEKRDSYYSRSLELLGGDKTTDEKLNSTRRRQANLMADRMMLTEGPQTSSKPAVSPGDTSTATANTTAPAPASAPVEAVPQTPAQQVSELAMEGQKPVDLSTPAPVAPAAGAAPAQKAFRDMSVAEQEKAITDSANYKLVYATAKDSGATDEVARTAAYDDTRRALENEYTGELTPEAITAQVAKGPIMAAYTNAVQADANARLEMAQLDELERNLGSQFRDLEADARIEQGKDLQLRLLAIQNMADTLRSSVVTDLMTAKTAKGMPPFAAVLGMLGAGLGSGGSVADFARERAKQDLAEQMSLIDRKRTLLGDLMTQGKDLPDAYKEADAQLRLLYATQIERSIPGLRDERARVKAQAEVAKIRMDALKDLNAQAIDANKAYFDVVKANISRANASAKPAIDYIKVMAENERARQARAAQLKAAGIRAEGAVKAAKVSEADKPLNPGLRAAQAGYTLREDQKINAVGSDKQYARQFVPPVKFTPEQVVYTDATGKTTKYSDTTLMPQYDKTKHRMAVSPEAANDIRAMDADTASTMQAIKILDGIGASIEYGAAYDAKKRADAEAARSDITAALARIFKLGTLQESDRQALKPLITNFETMSFDSYNRASIRGLAGILQRRLEASRNALLFGGTEEKAWDGKSDTIPAAGSTATNPAPSTPASTGDVVRLKDPADNKIYTFPKANEAAARKRGLVDP